MLDAAALSGSVICGRKSAYLFFAIVTLSFSGSAMASPAAQVVTDSDRKLCQTYNMNSMVRYFAENSPAMLAIKAAGRAVSEEQIAVGCSNGPLKILKDIRINENKYVILAKKSTSRPLTYTVINFQGVWKIYNIQRNMN